MTTVNINAGAGAIINNNYFNANTTNAKKQ